MKQFRKPGGFTLPELMITLGIVAIVLSTAVPSISSTIKDNRLVTQLNSVVADIHLARSEAAKRDTRVILCRSAMPTASSPVCGGDTRIWTSGYLIFADDGNYSNNVYNAGTDTLLRIGRPAVSGIEVRTSWSWNKNLEFSSTRTVLPTKVERWPRCQSVMTAAKQRDARFRFHRTAYQKCSHKT
jgi:type IV fimbrial biogenesis protein FimT